MVPSNVAQVAKIIPPLLSKFHKGQAGRVLVVGGSEDYTGAPFFAAMAAALVGADMSHILCPKDAGAVIKGYSPNLMVHPYLSEGGSPEKAPPLSDKVQGLLARVHAIVVGPGLGRDPALHVQVTALIKEARERKLPLVVDADGLFLVQNNLDVIRGADAILTPNVVEFGRLAKAAGIDEQLSEKERVQALAKALNVNLLVKGATDMIVGDGQLIESSIEGSPRRVSGQGDTLSGCLGTFLAWRQAYNQKLWSTQAVETSPTLLAALGASSIARTASRLAFDEHGRGMATTDVTQHVGPAFAKLYGDTNFDVQIQ